LSLAEIVLAQCGSFNTNVEGIIMDNSGNLFLVSDNYLGAACDVAGQKATLLLRLAYSKPATVPE
jgi:hypothetical protein